MCNRSASRVILTGSAVALNDRSTTAPRTRDGAPNVAAIAFAGDVSLVGRVQDLKTAFQILPDQNGARGIGLQVQRRKCALSGGPSHAVAGLAAELDIQHHPDVITICSTPSGTDSYITNTLLIRAATWPTKLASL